jgi:two-component system, NtrC family, response regulator AtoC
MPNVTPDRYLSRVLLVDDDPSFTYLFQRLIEKAGYSAITTNSGSEALQIIAERDPAVVFLDLMMPGVSGFDVLAELKDANINIPIVVITAYGSVENAVKTMHLGAADYLTKPLDATKIKSILENYVPVTDGTTSRLNEHKITVASKEERHVIVGSSDAMQEVFKLVGAVTMAPNEIPVLITGESGTGKELVAHAIHRNGSHPDEPFVSVNCTTLPESMLESELFGHEKGAFAGALEKRYGKFEYARSGTIFLDEVADLTPSLQQKMLRIIQEHEFERLGGNETIQIHARFITASNRDLEKLVEQGHFREDLYFRLRVFDIHLPSLKERKADIEELAFHFLQLNNRLLNKSLEGFAKEAVDVLMRYEFPGNVRELQNIVRKATILGSGQLIRANDIDIKSESGELFGPDFFFPFFSTNFGESRDYYIAEFEIQYVENILRDYKGNITLAANACGMTRQNLQRLITKHEIDIEFFRQI